MRETITFPSEQQREAFLNKPALAPPPGVTPNFVNPSNTRNDAATISMLVIATLFVWMRVYTKVRIVKKLHVDDYLLATAWALYAFGFHYYAFSIHQLPVGVHQWNITIRKLIVTAKLYHMANIFFVTVQIPLKASIVVQCLRVFSASGQRNATFWASQILLWFNTLYYTAIVLAQTWSCIPREAAWNPLVSGHCIDGKYIDLSFPIINTVSDICILAIPQREIWRLQGLSRLKKIQLSILFLFGTFACVASLVRLYFTINVMYRTDDSTYGLAKIGLWTEPELCAGFVAASAPVLPRFLKQITNSLQQQKWWDKRTKELGSPAPIEPIRKHRADPMMAQTVANPTYDKPDVLVNTSRFPGEPESSGSDDPKMRLGV